MCLVSHARLHVRVLYQAVGCFRFRFMIEPGGLEGKSEGSEMQRDKPL